MRLPPTIQGQVVVYGAIMFMAMVRQFDGGRRRPAVRDLMPMTPLDTGYDDGPTNLGPQYAYSETRRYLE